MPEILEPKVDVVGLVDLGLLGVAKVASERLLAPMVGDASIMSGVIKVIGGSFFTSAIGGKYGKIIGGGVIVDGVEDLALNLLGGVIPGGAVGAGGDW